MAVSCNYSIGDFGGQRNKYKQRYIHLREVVQVKIKNFIYIDGKPVDISTLTEEERKEISIQLNEKAAKQIGYERTA